MTTDQLTPEQKAASPASWATATAGASACPSSPAATTSRVPGRYGWDGGYGTSWASDPTEEMVAILMTQAPWASPSPPPVYLDFWTSAYQAIDD